MVDITAASEERLLEELEQRRKSMPRVRLDEEHYVIDDIDKMKRFACRYINDNGILVGDHYDDVEDYFSYFKDYLNRHITRLPKNSILTEITPGTWESKDHFVKIPDSALSNMKTTKL